MTEDELEELLTDCPNLYHMAERGSWKSIRERGLLSTSALLDLYEIEGADRNAIEATRRDTCVPIVKEGLPRAVVRDQLPMNDNGLRRCLPSNISPEDWYRLLNHHVFFWLTRDRLLRLTGAKAYKDKEHDVIQLDTRALIENHRENIVLCPINSGCTVPMPTPRDYSYFLPIEDYPYSSWARKRKRGERVVELVVKHSVPDLINYVQRVVAMKGKDELEVIYER